MSAKYLIVGTIIAAGFACTSTIQTGQAPGDAKAGKNGSKNALEKSGNELSDSDTATEAEHTHPEPEGTTPKPETPSSKPGGSNAAPQNSGNEQSGTKPPSTNGSADPNVVEFTIPAGTGRKAWNSPSDPIRVRQGQTLVVKNADSQMHWIHTNFSPFPHPFQGIAPGQSARYRINGTNASGMRDHLTFAPIYMTVTR